MSVLFYDGVDHMIEKITTLIKGKANNSHKHTKNDITDFPTLGTASSKDVASSGNASATQVVMGNDTRLSDARKASDVSAWAKASSKPSYTKSEIGLGNVDNTSDSSKPVSTAQQDAINAAYANANKYTDKKVADLIGSAPETMDILEEVAAAIQENKDVETALNEAIGKKANQTELDTHTGNSTIHITASERTNWNAAKTHADSAHARTDATKVEKSSTNGNIKINGTEKIVYTHPGSGTNPHGTTKSDVGLDNVGNFKAVSTVASQVLTDTEKANARTNIGAQAAGSYASASHTHSIANITNLQTTLDGKAPSNHTHSQYLTSHQDISGKADKEKYGDTIVSVGRKPDSTIGDNSFAFGDETTASGAYSHADGLNTTASGNFSHAEGWGTTATGEGSHAEGHETTASEAYSHAEGHQNTASEYSAHAEGNSNTASGYSSHAEGYSTKALDNQHAQGHFNNTTTATDNSVQGTSTGTAFVIGNGTGESSSNAFRVTGNGYVYATNATIQTGADYAEYFEWSDGNPDNEDRVGLFVTFDENNQEKIRIANSNDDYILGIVSGMPSVIGNGDEDWKKRYVLDDFGRYIQETFEYVIDGETKTGTKWKENPEYDSTKPYASRDERAEWSAIGLVGILSVYDDGTCQVNSYCKCKNNGIATASEKGADTYRVIKRVTDNIVKVVLK